MRRIIAPLISVLAIAGIAVENARPTVASVPADTLYGSALVELGDPGEQSIVTIDQNDGSITWLEPQAVNFQGLAFDSDGRLFATDGFEDGQEVLLMGTDPLDLVLGYDHFAAMEKMFWTEQRPGGVIEIANRDGSEVMTVVSEVNGAADIALDIVRGKMYWAAFNTAFPGTIERANLGGTGREVLVDDVNAFGVALDIAAGKLYWTEFTFGISPGALFRSNLDGSSIEFLIEGRKPRSITLDVASGKMYWTSNPVQGESGPGKIKRANLDGSGEEDVVVLPLNFGGIALDLDAGKMYWTHSTRIRRANLDGSEIEELIEFERLVSVGGIALDSGGGKMYWTFDDFGFEGGPSKIQRANLDGSGIEDLVTEGIGQPVGIALYLSDPDLLPALIAIDIKPGRDPNSINPSSAGNIPVAILGSESFDVADVDVTTLAFGPSGASFAHLHGPHFEDLNGDGFTDLIAHYRTHETGIARGDAEACVSGKTLDGAPFEGCDAVRAVPDMGLRDVEVCK